VLHFVLGRTHSNPQQHLKCAVHELPQTKYVQRLKVSSISVGAPDLE